MRTWLRTIPGHCRQDGLRLISRPTAIMYISNPRIRQTVEESFCVQHHIPTSDNIDNLDRRDNAPVLCRNEVQQGKVQDPLVPQKPLAHSRVDDSDHQSHCRIVLRDTTQSTRKQPGTVDSRRSTARFWARSVMRGLSMKLVISLTSRTPIGSQCKYSGTQRQNASATKPVTRKNPTSGTTRQKATCSWRPFLPRHVTQHPVSTGSRGHGFPAYPATCESLNSSRSKAHFSQWASLRVSCVPRSQRHQTGLRNTCATTIVEDARTRRTRGLEKRTVFSKDHAHRQGLNAPHKNGA